VKYKFEFDRRFFMGRKLTEEEFWMAFKDVLFSDEKIEDVEEEVEKIIRLGNLESGCRVLDMPCGIGRHTSVFEKKGFEVTGVENTQNYAKDAENRVEDSEIINQDMKEFKRENKFDAVVNWWNYFGYFEDKEEDFQILENIYASLKQKGSASNGYFWKRSICNE
jgi:cyclopropane fatty-acyl-phospholipid synthase-like methyltransferase